MVRAVLVAEDELLVAMDVQNTVEDAGYTVVGPYPTVSEALDALESQDGLHLDCAVLDVQLKDGEVFPLADRLHAMGVPIIFHSGHAGKEKLLARYPGASFCGKPSSPATLEREIVTALTGRTDFQAASKTLAACQI